MDRGRSNSPGARLANLTDAGRLPDDQARQGPRRISSAELLGQQRELMIEHAGEVYHLRCTGKGKLILTK